MGASNSKPQTVQMANPIQITRDVADRINQATTKNTNLGANLCETCKQKVETTSSRDTPSALNHKSSEEVQPVNVAKSWKKRSLEVEESQFEKSLQRVQVIFGKPVKWSKNCSDEIGKLEVELIHCYQRYPNETLQCSNLARQYHRFVFARQNAEIAKMKAEPHGGGDPMSFPR